MEAIQRAQLPSHGDAHRKLSGVLILTHEGESRSSLGTHFPIRKARGLGWQSSQNVLSRVMIRKRLPSHQLTWKCTNPCRKTTFLVERASLNFHVSCCEGNLIELHQITVSVRLLPVAMPAWDHLASSFEQMPLPQHRLIRSEAGTSLVPWKTQQQHGGVYLESPGPFKNGSMTPFILGNDSSFKGSWRLQVLVFAG